MTDFGISINIEQQYRVQSPLLGDGFRMIATVSAACGLPKSIFLYQNSEPSPDTGDTRPLFQAVASPMDLVYYPEDIPDINQSPAMYRKDVLDIIVPSQSAAKTLIEELRQEINTLINALQYAEEIVNTDTITFGDISCEDEATSESESLSESESI